MYRWKICSADQRARNAATRCILR